MDKIKNLIKLKKSRKKKKVRKQIVIGIDQSLTGTGYGVLHYPSMELIEYGVIKSKVKGTPRLIEISRDLTDTVKEYEKDHKIVSIGMEQYAYNKKFGGGRVFDLGELGGVIKTDMLRLGYDLEIITVQEHVKTLLGKLPKKVGDKLLRIHQVNRLYELGLRTGKTTATQDSDIADAISIGRHIVVKKRNNSTN